jgi:hypothetical protein
VKQVLVSVDHADGAAGVVLEGGEYWLAGYLDDCAGTRVDASHWAVHGLAGDRTAEGGVLPVGAVGAEALDRAGGRMPAAVGGRACVIVLDEPATGELHPVRFFVQDGQTVIRPLPAPWPRTPIDDVEEPCPACGGTAWDEVRPQDDSYGARSTPDGGWEPTPFYVCRTCGHPEPGGTTVAISFSTAQVDEEEIERQHREQERERQEELGALLTDCAFPVYAVVGLPVTFGGYGSDNNGLSEFTIVHEVPEGEIDVRTVREEEVFEGALELARAALLGQLWETNALPWVMSSGGSEAARMISSSAHDRALGRAVAKASTGEITIDIDGTPTRFEVAWQHDLWGAAHVGEKLAVVITARGYPREGLRLAPVING